ncbi:hypothetical protein [Fodinibius sp. Rm-B-1B1-1]|uniref:hypothetical protein n=1 Tax=Fodinibius alkaliphilus TaxID=3140241 RepID=UPI00315A414E
MILVSRYHIKNVAVDDYNSNLVVDGTYKVFLNELITMWDESDSVLRENLIKTITQSVSFHVDDDTEDIEINYLADK